MGLSSIQKNKIHSRPSRLRAWFSGVRCLHLALIASCLLLGAVDASGEFSHIQNNLTTLSHRMVDQTGSVKPENIGRIVYFNKETKRWHNGIRYTIDQGTKAKVIKFDDGKSRSSKPERTISVQV